ncbi:MAG: ABC-2 transporter permease [Candidatus Krumholzibacteria bacterium]|nr:ABC-2 transporter permease [Candidatus Krumholzibacteria bacterium]
MIGLMIKDLRHYAITLLVLGAGMPLYFSLAHGTIDSTAVYLIVGYLYLLTLAAIFAAELNESRYRGYEVLAALPVRPRSVVAGKFMLVLLTATAYTAVMWAFFARIGADTGAVDVARRWLLLNASASILVAGCSYLGAFRFGFDRWVWGHIFLMVISFAIPIALNESVEREILSGGTPLGRFIAGIDPLALCVVALGLFAGLWYAAAIVREGRDV